MQQSEICTPDSAERGHAANDEAEVLAIRKWAEAMAASERVPYRFEVRHDSIVAALTGDAPARVTECVADGVAHPPPGEAPSPQ